jgi:hypothetical protein
VRERRELESEGPFGSQGVWKNFTGLLSLGKFSCKAVRSEGLHLSCFFGKAFSPVLFKGKKTSTQIKGNVCGRASYGPYGSPVFFLQF